MNFSRRRSVFRSAISVGFALFLPANFLSAAPFAPHHDWTIPVGGTRIGFVEWPSWTRMHRARPLSPKSDKAYTEVRLGFTSFNIPARVEVVAGGSSLLVMAVLIACSAGPFRRRNTTA